MAYVAISIELQHAVRDGIKAMAKKELAAVGEIPKLTGTEPFVEQALWGQYASLRTQIPKEWKKSATGFTLRIELPTGGAWQDTVTLQTAQEAPPNYEYYRMPKVALHHDDPRITSFVSVITNRMDAQCRWEAVETQVMEFIGKCRSLNEGLKLWPDLRMYIPRQYLDRVERKVERSKDNSTAALDALKGIDTNKVVAAAVIARMAQTDNEEI